jgi:hypothetical protein
MNARQYDEFKGMEEINDVIMAQVWKSQAKRVTVTNMPDLGELLEKMSTLDKARLASCFDDDRARGKAYARERAEYERAERRYRADPLPTVVGDENGNPILHEGHMVYAGTLEHAMVLLEKLEAETGAKAGSIISPDYSKKNPTGGE